MKCIHFAGGILSVPDVPEAQVTGASGSVYRFEFDERFGPFLTTNRGRILANQPGERHEFWPAFEDWFDARRGLPPKCRACKGEGSVNGERIGRRSFIAKTCEACGGSGRAPRGEGA